MPKNRQIIYTIFAVVLKAAGALGFTLVRTRVPMYSTRGPGWAVHAV